MVRLWVALGVWALMGAAALTGCAAVQEVATEPRVALGEVRVVSLTLAEAQLAFDFEVHNPNPLGLSLGGLRYRLDLQDAPFVRGTHEEAFRVGGRDTARLTLPVRVNYAQALDTLDALRGAQTLRYRLSGDVRLGPFTVPYSREGALPVPRLPEVAVQSVDVEALNVAGAQLALGLRVRNANTFALRLNGLDYQLRLGDAPVLHGESTQPLDIAPEGSGVLRLRLWADYGELAGLAGLLRGRELPVSLAGSLKVPAPGGEFDVPYAWTGAVPLRR